MLDITSSSQVTLIAAFVAGLITFTASCLLPLVPTYLAYLSGIALAPNVTSQQRWKIVRTATSFVLGFILSFLTLGFSFRSLALYLNSYQSLIQTTAGVLFILLGLFVLNIFQHPLLATERKFTVSHILEKHVLLHAFLFGLAFGFGWSPCIGPVLAVILYWTSQAQTQLYGNLLLLVFSLGLGLPFIFIAAVFEKVLPLLKKYRKFSYYANLIAGTLIILLGILLVFSHVLAPGSFLLRFLPSYH